MPASPPIPTPPSPADPHNFAADFDGLLAVLDDCGQTKKLLCCAVAEYGIEYGVTLAKHLATLREEHNKKRDAFLKRWRKQQHDYLDAVAADLGI